MAKRLRDEDLRLNIIINGDAGRKEMAALERQIHDTGAEVDKLIADRKRMEAQGKKDSAEYRKLTSEINKSSKALEGYRTRLDTLRRQQSVNTMTLAELRKHITATTIALNKAVPGTEQWTKLNAELKLSKARLAELQAQSKVTGSVVQNLANKINRYIGIITAGFASMAFVISGINRSRKDFADFEEAVADVMKTTELTKQQVMELNEELKKYDTRTAQNELLDLARVAGKLGITAKEEVEEFVRAADKINVALSRDLGGDAEEAINQVGKLVDIFGLKQEFGIEQSMVKIGSAINELGMASTANEGYLVNFAKRVAGVAPNADIAITDVLGLAGTLDALGQTAEVSGTAYGMVITGMYKKTDVFARVAGMQLKDFKKLMAEDMNEAFIRVLEGIGSSGSMDAVVQSLDAIGLDGQRCTMVLGTLANNTDELRRQQELANKAFEEGSSLLEEFAVKNNTAQARLEKNKKAIVEQSVALGEKLVPIINVSLSGFTYLIKLLGGLIEVGTKYSGVIIALTALLAAHWVQQKATVVWGKLQAFWSAANRTALIQEAAACGTATASTQLLCAAKNLLVLNLKAAATAMKAFFASLGPVAWLTLGVGGLVAVFSSLKKKTKSATKELTAAEKATKAFNKAVEEQGYSIEEDVVKLESLSKSWKELGENMSAKEQFIKDNQKAFEDLGVAINNVNDADLLLITRTADYITAMRLRAEANIAEQTAQPAITRKFNAERALAALPDVPEVDDEDEESSTQRPAIGRGSRDYRDLAKTPDVKSDMNHTGSPDAKSQAKATSDIVKQERQRLQSEIASAEAEIDELYNIAAARRNAAEALIKGGGLDSLDDNGQGGGYGGGSEWSLANDEKFQKAKLALLKKYNTGEIASKEEYEAQLLQLEIDHLAKRIKLNTDSEETLLSLNTQYQEKLKEQKEVVAKADQELMKELAAGEADKLAEENALYEARKKKYQGNAEMLEAIEKVHNKNVAKIQLERIEKALKEDEAEYKRQRQLLLAKQKQELLLCNGTEQEKRRIKEKYAKQLDDLDSHYFEELQFSLAELQNAGIFFDGGDPIKIDFKTLSQEQQDQILAWLNKARDGLLGIQNVVKSSYSFTVGGGKDLLGFTADDWELLFDNIAAGKIGIEEVTMAVGALKEAYSLYSQFVAASEEKELNAFEDSIDEKKKQQKSLLDKGVINQEQYNQRIEALDEELDAKQKEIELAQARRKKALAIIEATIKVGVAVAEALVAQNYVGAGIAAAVGAAQIALIASTPIDVDGAASGGDIFVNRRNDNRPFKARLSPDQRGWVSSPTVLVGEEGPEYVIPAEGVNNPELYPIISTLETARRNGTLRSLKASAIYPTVSMPGYAHGGFTTTNSASVSNMATTAAQPMNEELMKQLLSTLNSLNDRMNGGIQAYVVMVGKNGLVEQMKKYEQTKQRGKV